jgi:hypothetical protein
MLGGARDGSEPASTKFPTARRDQSAQYSLQLVELRLSGMRVVNASGFHRNLRWTGFAKALAEKLQHLGNGIE